MKTDKDGKGMKKERLGRIIEIIESRNVETQEELASLLKKEGFESTIIEGNNGNVKVVYGYYLTEADAYSALNKMQGNAHFNQGWVTKIDKNK